MTVPRGAGDDSRMTLGRRSLAERYHTFVIFGCRVWR